MCDVPVLNSTILTALGGESAPEATVALLLERYELPTADSHEENRAVLGSYSGAPDR